MIVEAIAKPRAVATGVVLLLAFGCLAAPGTGASWNPWKTGVEARKFDAKAKRDERLPWTPDDVAKLTGKPAGSGPGFIREAYKAVAAKFGRQAGLDWYEFVLSKPTKFTLSDDDIVSGWNDYGFKAFNACDHSRVLEAIAALRKRGVKPSGDFAYRAVESVGLFEDLKTFPKDPASIVFPKENVWVKAKRTVHAKDFGWNPTDATACLQKALDSDADTVVVDKMESPWLIVSVNVPSNKTIVFEDGVRVHATESEQASNSRKTLFVLKETDNQALIGRGDVMIGKFPDGKTKRKYATWEGGTGVYIEGARHVLIRDLAVNYCGCDGVTFGGCLRIPRDVYLENVVLHGNTRQAMSICNACDVYMKNVRFTSTRGAWPMCGVDFEPSVPEVQATCNIYFLDCVFKDNHGGDFMIADYSNHPVTIYVKNCEIGGADEYGAITVHANPGYQFNRTDAPSDVLFEDCTIHGCASATPVTVLNANVFHTTFRNCEVVEGKGGWGGPTKTPFKMLLDYEHYEPAKDKRDWYRTEGSTVFENVKVKGWKGREPFAFVDRVGHYSVDRIFGKVSMNGKPTDMAKFRLKARDFAYTPVPVDVDPAKLKPIPKAKPSKSCGTVTFDTAVQWWTGDLRYEVFTRSGDTFVAKTMVCGKEPVSVAVSKPGVAFRNLNSDGLFRLGEGSAVYFVVPAGKGEATLKVTETTVAELLKGREKVMESFGPKTFVDGCRYVKVKMDKKPQIYGLRAAKGKLCFKFFAPFSGLVAADPLSLPLLEESK